MKTKNNVQKTENRKQGKSVTRTIVFGLLLVMTGWAMSVNSMTRNLSVNHSGGIAGAEKSFMQNGSEEFGTNDSKWSFLNEGKSISANYSMFTEEVIEPKLELESWMTNELNFGQANSLNTVEREEPLSIENWMLEDFFFSQELAPVDKEPAMKIESWMLDANNWKN